MRKQLGKLAVPLLISGSLVTAFPASAAPEGFVGGGFGYLRVENRDLEVDDDNAAYKAFGGVMLMEYFGLEGACVDFGESEGSLSQIEASGATAAVIGSIPFTPTFSAYGKAGVLFWDFDFRTPLGAEGDRDGSDPFFGVGAKFRITSQLDLRLEYERFELDDADVDLATANLQFVFGKR